MQTDGDRRVGWADRAFRFDIMRPENGSGMIGTPQNERVKTQRKQKICIDMIKCNQSQEPKLVIVQFNQHFEASWNGTSVVEHGGVTRVKGATLGGDKSSKRDITGTATPS